MDFGTQIALWVIENAVLFNHKTTMKRLLLLFTLTVIAFSTIFAQSEPSTYFNIYVPPNNEPLKRNVALIVTAIADSTNFEIIDDDMDGDNDDSVSGMLMAGQSHIVYIADGGVNDDALYASGGVLKRNGDYFFIHSDKLVYASMSTDSDWQHDFVPSVNKKSIGQKFYLYTPKGSSTGRDINVFAYEQNTTVTISRISVTPTLRSGHTHVDPSQRIIVAQRTLSPGQDLIYHHQDGRKLLEAGHTYVVEANKDVTVQYGSLMQNSRDGGAYVPSSNGSGSGDLFYFAVPYQTTGEQEIRIISWDDDNQVRLERYSQGTWVVMSSWQLNAMQPADWVGKQHGNVSYPTVFRVTATPGKRVSVFEANWMETGSNTTSDMATMVSSANGTSSGTSFLAYMLPPSRQSNVVNPFTGQLFEGSISHFYLFASDKPTTVTIKDAKTNGRVLHRTYEIEANRYYDAYFTLDEWRSIYNGTGSPTGADRPYVMIEATQNIAVLSTNFNDNWMTHFGSSLAQGFTQSSSASTSEASPGGTVTLVTQIVNNANSGIDEASIEVRVGSGLIPYESTLSNLTTDQQWDGAIQVGEQGSVITFTELNTISGTDDLQIETKVVVHPTYNDGTPVPSGTVISVETVVTGIIDGTLQQSVSSQGIQNNSDDNTNLMFSLCGTGPIVNSLNDSWNGAWVDFNRDGFDDLFVTNKQPNEPNEMYQNNGNGTFTRLSGSPLLTQTGNTVAAVWADVTNNGWSDVLVVNATGKPAMLYLNKGNGEFVERPNSGIDIHPQYFHGAAFADFDNDGFVDLLITNFFPTRFHQLYRNQGDGTFRLVTNTPVTMVSERAMAPVLVDFDQDGYTDVFIPNGNDRPNSLFRNIGGFQFEAVTEGAIVTDAFNSVGAAWGDFTGNGFPDLYVVNASGQNNNLYINHGGHFTKDERSVVAQQGGHNHGAVWFDANNNGWLDLFVTNDQGANALYLNDGNGGFERRSGELIGGNTGRSYGAAVSDINRDGYLDVMIFNQGGQANRLFCNNGKENNWVSFQLVGTASNRSAVGARISIKSNDRWQTQSLYPVSGFGSQNTSRLHFGLHQAATIDSLIIHWPSGHKQIISEGIRVNQHHTIKEEDAAHLHGITFHDLNNNGVRDENEPLVGNVNLEITENRRSLRSGSDGRFSTRVNSGDYTIALVSTKNWYISGEHTAKVAPSDSEKYLAIPLRAISNGHDLTVTFATTAWRRGFPNETIVQIANIGTAVALDAEVSLLYPDEGYLLTAQNPFHNDGKSYTWKLPEINVGERISLAITDSIGLEAFTGQILSFSARISAPGVDLDRTNNLYSEEITVVGAIDPNDIVVTPLGEGRDGFIEKDQVLTYTIRFENVGSWPATYVFIDNQISENLDIASFTMIASSHPSTYRLHADGLLEIAYLNINLPPTEVDSIGSHGYFKYSARPKSDIKPGDRILNVAEIVFDFEAPIITNTTLHTIFRTADQIQPPNIYPNPFNPITQIQFDVLRRSNVTVQVFDIAGRLVETLVSGQQAAGTHTISWDASRLASGIYLVRMQTDTGIATQKITLIK
jgi:uncharacterized repeat protein (TIGR01451 family)